MTEKKPKGGKREGAGRPKNTPGTLRPTPISWRPKSNAAKEKYLAFGGAKWLDEIIEPAIDTKTTPVPAEVLAAREAIQARLGLDITAAQDWCALAIHTKREPWQQCETGARIMHPAFWELLQFKTQNHVD